MSTEKMRHDFEQFVIRRDGSIWVTVMGDQRSYNEPIERDFSTWCESRAAIEVELPEIHTMAPDDDKKWHGCRNSTIRTCARAIELVGLKVKP